MVHRLQPKAVIFSDAGPDIRWVGNKSGYAFKSALETDFPTDLAPQAKVSADCDRGSGFSATRTTDNDNSTYWGAPDSITQGILTFSYAQPVSINLLPLQEPVNSGQGIRKFPPIVYDSEKNNILSL